MATLLVIEYQEGCGYNCRITTDCGDEYWASRYPFNRVEMQNRINRFVSENPNSDVKQEMVYSEPFPIIQKQKQPQ